MFYWALTGFIFEYSGSFRKMTPTINAIVDSIRIGRAVIRYVINRFWKKQINKQKRLTGTLFESSQELWCNINRTNAMTKVIYDRTANDRMTKVTTDFFCHHLYDCFPKTANQYIYSKWEINQLFHLPSTYQYLMHNGMKLSAV